MYEFDWSDTRFAPFLWEGMRVFSRNHFYRCFGRHCLGHYSGDDAFYRPIKPLSMFAAGYVNLFFSQSPLVDGFYSGFS